MNTISKIRDLRAAKGMVALAVGLALAVPVAFAQVSSYGDKQMGDPASDHLPAILSKATIVQKLNTQIPLDSQFVDETGKTVHMGDYFGNRPAILSLVYYTARCSAPKNWTAWSAPLKW